jgi:hypothetical protein
MLNAAACMLLFAALPINWAYGDQNALVKHARSGSLAVGLAGGGSTIAASDRASELTACRIAHGALMLAAFLALMPTAVLLARHKWLFGHKEVSDYQKASHVAD